MNRYIASAYSIGGWMQLSTSGISRAVSILEGSLRISATYGIRITSLLVVWFFIYVVSGFLGKSFGFFNPGYGFLSLETDPVFIFCGVLVGLSIAQTSGSLILYHFLVSSKSERTAIPILFSYIGLGFGGALLRITLPPAIQMLLRIVN